MTFRTAYHEQTPTFQVTKRCLNYTPTQKYWQPKCLDELVSVYLKYDVY